MSYAISAEVDYRMSLDGEIERRQVYLQKIVPMHGNEMGKIVCTWTLSPDRAQRWTNRPTTTLKRITSERGVYGGIRYADVIDLGLEAVDVNASEAIKRGVVHDHGI